MIKLSIIVPVYNTEQYIKRCLDSIELLDNIELIIIDDCSKDKSVEIIEKWINKTDFKNIKLIKNDINIGIGLVMNKGYETATGEYIMTLCDDDYLIYPTSKILKELTGEDLIYYNMRINNGTIWKLNNKTKYIHVGATKIYKKSIIGDTKRLEKRLAGDSDFYYEIMKKNPTEKFTNIEIYHYNFPRQNSLVDKIIKEVWNGRKD